MLSFISTQTYVYIYIYVCIYQTSLFSYLQFYSIPTQLYRKASNRGLIHAAPFCSAAGFFPLHVSILHIVRDLLAPSGHAKRGSTLQRLIGEELDRRWPSSGRVKSIVDFLLD